MNITYDMILYKLYTLQVFADDWWNSWQSQLENNEHQLRRFTPSYVAKLDDSLADQTSRMKAISQFKKKTLENKNKRLALYKKYYLEVNALNSFETTLIVASMVIGMVYFLIMFIEIVLNYKGFRIYVDRQFIYWWDVRVLLLTFLSPVHIERSVNQFCLFIVLTHRR